MPALRAPAPRLQFKTIVMNSWKALLILLALDMVVTGPARWFELHVDFLSVQATLIGEATTFRGRMGTHFTYYANNKKG